MKLALMAGVIDSIPETPKENRTKVKPRTFFRFSPLVSKELDDYQRLLRHAEELAGQGITVRGIPLTDELRDIILFTVHSFVRPTHSELYALRRSDVAVADNPKRLILTVRSGKTGFRTIDTMPAAVNIHQRCLQRYPDYADREDYLFLPQYKNRNTALRIIMRQFNHLLEVSGMKTDPYTKQPFSMYSLRHTALCMRLVLSGGKVNLYALARNAGTSVEMLEKHYLKHLPNSDILARNIQSFANDG